MPPRKPPRSVAEQVDDEIKQEISDLVGQIAAEEGPAPHAQYVSDDHEVEMWGQQDPQVDHETLVQQLMQGAVPPELVDTAADRPFAAVKDDPEWAKMFAEPLDAEMAEMVATFTEFPFRRALLSPYADDPEASIKKSDSLTARWRRRLPARRAAPQISATPTSPVVQPVQVQPVVPPAPLSAPPGFQPPLEASNPPPGAPPSLPPLLSPPAASIGVSAPPLPREQLGGY